MKNFYKKIFTEINDNLNKTDYNSIEKITKLILLTNKKNKKSLYLEMVDCCYCQSCFSRFN